ncbi:hypothetical protein K505DRAFT_288134, partial [Melanomma pulvis-pyrius CBS 109.77]
MKMISWALNEKDLVRRLDRLSRAKESLQLSLAVDQTTLLLQSRNDSQSFKSAIEEVNTEQERRSIIKWLGAPFPSSAFNDAQKLRSENTGEWFLKCDSFDHWKKSPQSVLWLNGIPGSGKTVLCSSIIKELAGTCQSDDDSLLVYFFFDFTTRDKRIVSLFLRSLLSQILVQKRKIPEPIRLLYDQHHGGFQEPGITTLLNALRATLNGAEQTYFVIDAIDECSEMVEFLETFEEILDWSLGNVHILATSRREKDIEECLVRVDSKQLRVEGEAVNKDIREYVHRRMLKERWLKKWPLDVQTEITSIITAKAGEMFRLATFQLDELKKCGTLKTLRKALYSLPTTLDEIYSRMLSNIAPENAQNALRVLSWLCFAFRPIYLDELAEALATDLESLEYDANQKLQDPEDILSICGSLVMRSGESGRVLKLSHYSVKEYLTSARILNSHQSSYYIARHEADISITKTCLVYLRGRHYKSKDEAVAARLEHPLTKYSTDFWTAHFLRTREAPELLPLALDLFVGADSCFLNWAWLSTVVGSGVYTESPRPELLTKTNIPNILLYYSALIGSSKLIEAMLDRGAKIDSEGGVFGTALSVAAHTGDIRNVELLLSRGADVNVQMGYFGNALQAAASKGLVDIVKLLLSHGA